MRLTFIFLTNFFIACQAPAAGGYRAVADDRAATASGSMVLKLVTGTPSVSGAAHSGELSPTAKAAKMPLQGEKLNDLLDNNYGAVSKPTPTENEKKMRPAVEKAEIAFILFVWARIILEKLGLKK